MKIGDLKEKVLVIIVLMLGLGLITPRPEYWKEICLSCTSWECPPCIDGRWQWREPLGYAGLVWVIEEGERLWLSRDLPDVDLGGEKSDESGLATPDLINGAFKRGEISESERLMYLTYAIYEYESLPERFRGSAPWEGTWVLLEISEISTSRELFCGFENKVRKELQRLVPEVVECD